MDACTASTLRVLLVLMVIAMATMGLWTANKNLFCRYNRPEDVRRCTVKSFMISTAVIAAGIFLTTLVIVRSQRVDSETPSTTDLLNNLA